MANYLLLYSGGSMPESEAEQAASCEPGQTGLVKLAALL